jgi:hypothetical protein
MVRKGPGGRILLHMFLYFSIISDVIRWWLVLLMALAASGHLAYHALCFVSLIFPSSGRPTWSPPIFFSPEPEPAFDCFQLPGFEPRTAHFMAQSLFHRRCSSCAAAANYSPIYPRTFPVDRLRSAHHRRNLANETWVGGGGENDHCY